MPSCLRTNDAREERAVSLHALKQRGHGGEDVKVAVGACGLTPLAGFMKTARYHVQQKYNLYARASILFTMLYRVLM